MGRRIAQIICFAFGALLFALYFSQHPTARSLNTAVMIDYWQIIFAITLLVGVISFVRINLSNIRRGDNRPYRIISLVGLAVMPILAIIWGIKGNSPFMWMFEYVQVPMQSTVFALLAFFVASASFRGFRARSAPAAVLLTAALLTLTSRSSLEGIVPQFITEAADWVRGNPSMAARRAILIGIGLGSLTTSLRVILGIERTWLGSDK
ncbi:MAG: hypothetical protein DRP47_06770 [Candidatus Zixiibacteriota bacterium]|nr:MAG: hypothetical protein DRP47_06770 [candidate division Zixibacteria bacterium]